MGDVSKNDWRLRGQQDYLNKAVLSKATFPDFWEKSYREKNEFCRKIVGYAHRFVAQTGRGQEYLEGENVRHFWHEHCEFCWEKVRADMECEFYCTQDFYYWICPECFRDFRDEFEFEVTEDL